MFFLRNGVGPGRRLFFLRMFFLRNAPAAVAAWPLSYEVASARAGSRERARRSPSSPLLAHLTRARVFDVALPRAMTLPWSL